MGVLRGAVGRGEAEDCFQETFLAALRAYPRLDDTSNLRGWLLTIAHRKAIDHHRANGRRPMPVAEVVEVGVNDPEPRRRDLGRGRRATAKAARRGGPALRLRPPPRRDRRRPGLLAGSGPPQPARGNEATEEGAGMKAELQRLADRAAAEGLLDVAYTTMDSPFGTLLLATTPRGLGAPGAAQPGRGGAARRPGDSRLPPSARSAYATRRDPPRTRPLLRRKTHKLRPPPRLAAHRRLPRQESNTRSPRIPYGKTRSYTEMARKAGNERAVRAAGTACGTNPLPIVVPCHRVLRTGGALGGYGGGLPMKKALLKMEGVLE